MHRLRHRRRVARALAEAKTLRARIRREWHWALRDIQDLRDDIARAQRINRAIRELPPEPIQIRVTDRSTSGHR